MTMHYHGTPITPVDKLYECAGRNFCVSYAAPNQVQKCHEIGQSVMLDNGAFTFWRQGTDVSGDWWDYYYRWCSLWLDYRTTWAVIPDVIDGTEQDNDHLIDDWPFGLRGAPVWHMHESIHRLKMLCAEWPRVCIGSSGQYATVGDFKWHQRMIEAMNEICGDGPAPCWLHMLRGMNMVDSGYPFASVDSTDVAQNHNRGTRGREVAGDKAARWDALQAPARWSLTPTQQVLTG